MVKTFIVFVLMIGFLISIHELGHLIAAKWAGVYCFEYSIGMGPLLFKKKGKETQYSIRALPIGGYVAMAGETEDSKEAYPDVDVPQGRHLFEVPKWKQTIVMAAGIIMNIVVAFAFIYVAILINGEFVKSTPGIDRIVAIEPGSAAEIAGLQVDDTIVGFEQDDVTIYFDKKHQLSDYVNDQPITLVVERDGQQQSISVTPVFNKEASRYLMGITSTQGHMVKANPFNAIYGSIDLSITIASQIFTALKGMVSGDGFKNVSGIVGVYQATDMIVQTGLTNILVFVGMFSLNLAIFNALPLPALDGGRIVLLGFEKLLGKKMNKRVENWLIMGSFMFLIGLTILITFKDIINLFK